MARIDPWAAEYTLPTPEPITRTLTAPQCPDLTLTLRPLDELDQLVVLDTVQDWETRYLKGAEPLGVPLDVRKKLSRRMLHNIAVVRQMEVPPEGEAGYDLAEWLGLAKNLNALWVEVIQFVNEVQAAHHPKN